MVFEVFAIGAAFVFGLAARPLGLPPLVGFLAAGFVINAAGPHVGMPDTTGPILEYIANLGVLILLFTVGLKLKIKQIGEPHVVGVSLLHFALSVALFTPLARAFFTDDWTVALLVGIALAFSSTVLAAKMLESKREMGTFHGRTAIGILIVQDIIALVVLAIFSGKVPGPWALLIFATPLLRPFLHKLLDWAGHDEVLVLAGMALALVIGGYGFEIIGLKGEIGALVMGLLLSNHPRASELSDALWSLKEIFLVGFFLSIGMSGLPDWDALIFAVVLGLMLPLKGILFFFLLLAFRLRARTAFLSALSLTVYSEFGLIVATGIPAAEPFVVPLAIAVSVSFLIAAPINRLAHPLYERFEQRLHRFERVTRHPDEQPADLGDADVLIFGMGRTGSATYEVLIQNGSKPIGLDADTYKAAAHAKAGRNVVFADAEDSNFWSSVELGKIKAAVLAMDDLEAKLIATRTLRAKGFTGPIVTHALHEEHIDLMKEAGANQTYLTMREAGRSLAHHASGTTSVDPLSDK
ncbi:cation:proton antiporter family protein [Roseobacter litoralis]|uniref:Sodium/hydrogen exchanger n=1 Tax=Roseobacter litoralis (strain ATCC 49566 / DSM 6996 / JCM 21268 / NBRC 15278 / OCh 149) TaxID=391595 RepID=F7ZI30_ROSLO|nr:cation:proton antiporter family protein [Roseobacter litoralis]AEI94980.1 putative sodium/hydrogen exchanger [Roseobacter litoralis Och 149]